jgi:hypothetical protein
MICVFIYCTVALWYLWTLSSIRHVEGNHYYGLAETTAETVGGILDYSNLG